MSRTSLSSRVGTLRFSLLTALGLVPFACGGTVVTTGDGSGGADARGGGTARAGGSFGGLPTFGGAGGGAGFGVVCVSPTVDPVSHLVQCANGPLHRPVAYACADIGAAEGGAGGDSAEAGAAGASDAVYCVKDADCRGLLRGYCDFNRGPFEAPTCRSGCRVDADCGSAALCVCDGHTPGRCMPAGCHTDADCPASMCALTASVCDQGSFECITPKDQCLSNADCSGGACAFFGIRACTNAVCGRPFLVDEAARLASVESRRDWVELGLQPDLASLSPLERAGLARHWAHLGQMEHASIAAFARFNLQLLSLGAPANLVEACNRALSDETRHARLCFALASHYGGIALGPSKLEVRDCFAECDLGSVMKLVLSEGCIGETVAALDAMEQAATASDPVVRDVLRGIARDEQRHAELAYRFMRWALAQSSAELRTEMVGEARARITAYEQTAEGVQFVAAREVAQPLIEALFVENVLG